MEHTFGSWVDVSIYRNPASSPLSLSMRFDANRANNTRDFGSVSAAFRVSSKLNPCAYFGAIGDWAWGAGAPPGSTRSHRLCLPQGTATFFVIPRWLEIQPVIEAPVLAAADVLFD